MKLFFYLPEYLKSRKVEKRMFINMFIAITAVPLFVAMHLKRQKLTNSGAVLLLKIIVLGSIINTDVI